MQPSVPGMEDDISGNRVDHRLRATCVRASSPALVVKPECQATDTARLLPGASPDGKQPKLTWIRKPCCSDRRRRQAATTRFSLDEILPVHSAGGWPEDLSLRREDIYEDRI